MIELANCPEMLKEDRIIDRYKVLSVSEQKIIENQKNILKLLSWLITQKFQKKIDNLDEKKAKQIFEKNQLFHPQRRRVEQWVAMNELANFPEKYKEHRLKLRQK